MARVPLLLLLALTSLVLSTYCTGLPAVDTNDPDNDAYNGFEDGDEMTGFPLNDLDDNVLEELMEVEVNILLDQTGVHIAKKLFQEAEDLRTKSKGAVRRKRAIGPILRGAFVIARAFLKKIVKGRVTRIALRSTRQYHTRGTYKNIT